MAERIEDYAVIGDTQTLALVGLHGSIDWLCLPRFDSAACFAALLGGPDNGRWLLAPEDVQATASRRYRRDTLILETEFRMPEGAVRVIDSMPIRGRYPNVVRVVEGIEGSVPMRSEVVIRYDYGNVVPWMEHLDGRMRAVAGPDALELVCPVQSSGKGNTSVTRFEVRAGQRVPFVLTWHPSHEAAPPSPDAFSELEKTEAFWVDWASRGKDRGRCREEVMRSLITLKALTYAPTGGIVAAGTTSLPECIGGSRNWDYRYCWLRDATFTLHALLHGGYAEEARAFRDWLLRAVAGHPSKLQIAYGVLGERHMDQRELDWLSGYEGSRPVRIGNGAASQLQLDVYGEVGDTLHEALKARMGSTEASWRLERSLCEWLESNWAAPDAGLWETRGPRRHFTHSKVMTWVAMDRAIKAVERHGMEGPVERWRCTRETIRRDVCQNGWNADIRSFVQFYGSNAVDASLLLVPVVGFLPASDERVRGTVRAVEERLLQHGFVQRYRLDRDDGADQMGGSEGSFLACSFWLVDAYVLDGRYDEARKLYARLVAVANDVGLLSEEYDPVAGRLLGNFPQALSHVALINSARNLASGGAAAKRRSEP